MFHVDVVDRYLEVVQGSLYLIHHFADDNRLYQPWGGRRKSSSAAIVKVLKRFYWRQSHLKEMGNRY